MRTSRCAGLQITAMTLRLRAMTAIPWVTKVIFENFNVAVENEAAVFRPDSRLPEIEQRLWQQFQVERAHSCFSCVPEGLSVSLLV